MTWAHYCHPHYCYPPPNPKHAHTERPRAATRVHLPPPSHPVHAQTTRAPRAHTHLPQPRTPASTPTLIHAGRARDLRANPNPNPNTNPNQGAPETFVPLDTIRTTPIAERMRCLGGSKRPVIDATSNPNPNPHSNPNPNPNPDPNPNPNHSPGDRRHHHQRRALPARHTVRRGRRPRVRLARRGAHTIPTTMPCCLTSLPRARSPATARGHGLGLRAWVQRLTDA